MATADRLQLDELSQAPKQIHPTFTTARSLLGLTSGMVVLDSLIGGLKSDTVALITGSIGLQAAERYCVRVQLPPARGGLESGAFFVDGGNSFDIYLFTELVHEHHLAYNRALERQLLSRAFTIYELRSLIQGSDILFAAEKRPKLLVVSEVFSLFNEDVEKVEARQIVGEIASSISEISERQKVPVVITSADRPVFLTQILEAKCSVSAEITDDGRRTTARLFKHPWKNPMETSEETGPNNYNQDTLDAGAKPHG
jgi:Rad51